MMPNNLSEKLDEPDINDVFDDILLTEEKVIEKSYQQGFVLGSNEESIDGYHLGYHRGAEIGSEIGYCHSFAEHYLQNGDIPDKCLKDLTALKELCESFPRTNAEDVDFLETLEKLRSLYKKICAKLKLKSGVAKKESVTF